MDGELTGRATSGVQFLGLDITRLLQSANMADWRQIQARIRKAKNSPEAVSKLSELFERTRDGMVAWELGVLEEKADHKEEAGNWYILAAQRFRRADWKKKAEEALARLGIPLPQGQAALLAPQESSEAASTPAAGELAEPGLAETPEERSEPVSDAPEAGRRKRRRGRRGGRGRRRGGVNVPAAQAQTVAERTPSLSPPPEATFVEPRTGDGEESEPAAPEHLRRVRAESPPQLPSERMAHGRSEPGLASRMAHLESLLRRLLGSPLRRLESADEAPAGPGVFLLSDSDQTTSYYVEACQTLRVGIGNLVRGGRTGQSARATGRGSSETSLKAKLARHLEISEAKVSQYMKDHCVIRWIQLDDDAPLLAHFAIAVLRTPLNLD
jgi:hypothetical protein